jgi:hypothetical protein
LALRFLGGALVVEGDEAGDDFGRAERAVA